MCIGVGVTEFSYQWVGCAVPPTGATTRFNLAAVHDRNRTPSQNGSGPERRRAERCSACPALRPGPRSEQAHESAGGEIGGKEVRVFQSGSAGQGFGGEVSAADGAFHGCGPAAWRSSRRRGKRAAIEWRTLGRWASMPGRGEYVALTSLMTVDFTRLAWRAAGKNSRTSARARSTISVRDLSISDLEELTTSSM